MSNGKDTGSHGMGTQKTPGTQTTHGPVSNPTPFVVRTPKNPEQTKKGGR